MRGERRQRRHREKKVREVNEEDKQIFSGEGEVKGEAGLQGW